jgi:hypothetical protein
VLIAWLGGDNLLLRDFGLYGVICSLCFMIIPKYYQADKIKKNEVVRVLVGNPEGKSPLGRPRRRWENGI